MKHPLLAAAAALLLVGSGARAATFDLSVIGSGIHWYANGSPGCEGVPSCNEGGVDETWLGDLSLQTASADDGTYAIESLAYSSNVDEVVSDQQHLVYPQFDGGPPYLAGLTPGASVTIANGRVIAVTGSFVWDGGGSLSFSGLSVTDLNGGQEGQPNADFWRLAGVLVDGSTPAALPAPEPATWMLLAIGLAVTRIARCAGKCSPPRSS